MFNAILHVTGWWCKVPYPSATVPKILLP